MKIKVTQEELRRAWRNCYTDGVLIILEGEPVKDEECHNPECFPCHLKEEPKKVIEELEYRIWNEVVLNGLKEDVKHAASDWDMHNKINEIIRFLTHLK